MYSETYQPSMIELSILDVWQSFEYTFMFLKKIGALDKDTSKTHSGIKKVA